MSNNITWCPLLAVSTPWDGKLMSGCYWPKADSWKQTTAETQSVETIGVSKLR